MEIILIVIGIIGNDKVFMCINTFCIIREIRKGIFMRYNTKKILIMFLCSLLVFVLIHHSQSYAKTSKQKALDAYNILLSGKSIKWGNTNSQIPLEGCSFALAYIDNNSVPELILQNLSDTDHAIGYGLLYTYKDSKLVCLESLSMNDTFYYYKKKGIYIDNYTGMGFSLDYYNKLSGTKISTKLIMRKNYLADNSVVYSYSKGSGKITKAQFKKNLRKLVGSKKKIVLRFYQNTPSNRSKYL